MLHRHRVLLVDDDNTFRYAMGRELAAAGYQVADAHDFRDALEILEDGPRCAVLVTDVVLPGVNGFALARMARMRHHNIKIVYITAFDDLPLHEANGPILRKPITPDVLLSTVRDVLERTGRPAL